MSIDICNSRTFEFWDTQNQLLEDKHNGIDPDNELVDYLFNNLVSISERT